MYSLSKTINFLEYKKSTQNIYLSGTKGIIYMNRIDKLIQRKGTNENRIEKKANIFLSL